MFKFRNKYIEKLWGFCLKVFFFALTGYMELKLLFCKAYVILFFA